jgi:hypothetical protein
MKAPHVTFFLYSALLGSNMQHLQENQPQPTIEQVVIQTIINQKTSIENKPTHLFGKKLNAYLNRLDTKTFKDFFTELPLRAKIMYMLTITIEEYELFLERYTNEEWTNFWLAASPEEQKHLPKTRTEQLLLVRDAYYAYLENRGTSLFSYFNPKSPYPSDIDIFKKRFYIDDNLPSPSGDMHIFAKNSKHFFVDAYMFRKRQELFNL